LTAIGIAAGTTPGAAAPATTTTATTSTTGTAGTALPTGAGLWAAILRALHFGAEVIAGIGFDVVQVGDVLLVLGWLVLWRPLLRRSIATWLGRTAATLSATLIGIATLVGTTWTTLRARAALIALISWSTALLRRTLAAGCGLTAPLATTL
jgi:hypothetical protein